MMGKSNLRNIQSTILSIHSYVKMNEKLQDNVLLGILEELEKLVAEEVHLRDTHIQSLQNIVNKL